MERASSTFILIGQETVGEVKLTNQSVISIFALDIHFLQCDLDEIALLSANQNEELLYTVWLVLIF